MVADSRVKDSMTNVAQDSQVWETFTLQTPTHKTSTIQLHGVYANKHKQVHK